MYLRGHTSSSAVRPARLTNGPGRRPAYIPLHARAPHTRPRGHPPPPPRPYRSAYRRGRLLMCFFLLFFLSLRPARRGAGAGRSSLSCHPKGNFRSRIPPENSGHRARATGIGGGGGTNKRARVYILSGPAERRTHSEAFATLSYLIFFFFVFVLFPRLFFFCFFEKLVFPDAA